MKEKKKDRKSKRGSNPKFIFRHLVQKFNFAKSGRTLIGGLAIGAALFFIAYIGSKIAEQPEPTLNPESVILTSVAQTSSAISALETPSVTPSVIVTSTVTPTPEVFNFNTDFPGANVTIIDENNGQTNAIVIVHILVGGQPYDAEFKIEPAMQQVDGSWNFMPSSFATIYNQEPIEDGYILRFLEVETSTNYYYFYSDEVSCWAENTSPLFPVFPIFDGKTTEITINLSKVELNVFDPTGKPAGGVDVLLGVELSSSEGASMHECSGKPNRFVTDAQGVGTILVIEGKYFYSVSEQNETKNWHPFGLIGRGEIRRIRVHPNDLN